MDNWTFFLVLVFIFTLLYLEKMSEGSQSSCCIVIGVLRDHGEGNWTSVMASWNKVQLTFISTFSVKAKVPKNEG